METTERIVEAYVRYVKRWATIPNIRCSGQNEIDLIAIDPVTLARSHIEVSISISQGFRKLTGKSFDRVKVKERVHQASQRRTVGFFAERKFDAPTVIARLKDFGFEPGHYARVIVTWGWEDEAEKQAEAAGIELWDFREIVQEIARTIRGSREYFADDTLRTLNLFIHAGDEAARSEAEAGKGPKQSGPATRPVAPGEQFWVYENWTHQYASVHRGSCAHCNDGRGAHGVESSSNGKWRGPFGDAAAAWLEAENTGRKGIRCCGVCSPVRPI